MYFSPVVGDIHCYISTKIFLSLLAYDDLLNALTCAIEQSRFVHPQPGDKEL